jgi:hypothetical protein
LTLAVTSWQFGRTEPANTDASPRWLQEGCLTASGASCKAR